MTDDRKPSEAAREAASKAWYERITTQPTVHGMIEELALALDDFATMSGGYGEGYRAGVIDRPYEIEVTPPEREALRIAQVFIEGLAFLTPVPHERCREILARIRAELGEKVG